MSCKQCASENLKSFSSEVAIHFPGLAGLNKPIVWVFPKMLVCSRCGFAEFMVPEKELSVLVHGGAVRGVAVGKGGDSPERRF